MLNVIVLLVQTFLVCFPNPALLFSNPTASVEPTLVRVPDVDPHYVTFRCNGTVPKALVVNKEIAWLVDGAEVIDGVSATTNPMGVSSTSELQTVTLSNSGTYNYTCLVTLAVTGDPVLQDIATALVNVTGKCIHIQQGTNNSHVELIK